jgi:hypothetical protein
MLAILKSAFVGVDGRAPIGIQLRVLAYITYNAVHKYAKIVLLLIIES